MMRFILLFFFILPVGLQAQTKTTQALDDRYDGLSLYFYRNTLRMLNQTEDKSFDELIKDIEKMRFLMIDKTQSKFGNEEYRKLLSGYQSEAYEEIMTGRYEGRTFGVYLKEKNGHVLGTVILANDSTNLFVLDILGKVALDKAPQLFSIIDSNTDIGEKIKSFTNKDKPNKEKERKDGSDN
jgi:hypothetical protein